MASLCRQVVGIKVCSVYCWKPIDLPQRSTTRDSFLRKQYCILQLCYYCVSMIWTKGNINIEKTCNLPLLKIFFIFEKFLCLNTCRRLLTFFYSSRKLGRIKKQKKRIWLQETTSWWVPFVMIKVRKFQNIFDKFFFLQKRNPKIELIRAIPLYICHTLLSNFTNQGYILTNDAFDSFNNCWLIQLIRPSSYK